MSCLRQAAVKTLFAKCVKRMQKQRGLQYPNLIEHLQIKHVREHSDFTHASTTQQGKCQEQSLEEAFPKPLNEKVQIAFGFDFCPKVKIHSGVFVGCFTVCRFCHVIFPVAL